MPLASQNSGMNELFQCSAIFRYGLRNDAAGKLMPVVIPMPIIEGGIEEAMQWILMRYSVVSHLRSKRNHVNAVLLRQFLNTLI